MFCWLTWKLPSIGGAPSTASWFEGTVQELELYDPAGGFYSASGEDVYPNLWSAVFAADAIKLAWKEPHLQDALQTYRHQWRKHDLMVWDNRCTIHLALADFDESQAFRPRPRAQPNHYRA